MLKPHRRVVNQNQFGRALADTQSPIATLFVFNSNPAAVAPDSNAVRRGLAREDLFTVVLEHFQTDTADYADILLPATTFVEHPDIYTAYGHYYLQWAEPIVRPRGDAKPNSWVFKQLAVRVGLTDEVFSWNSEQMAAELLKSSNPNLNGITFERLKLSEVFGCRCRLSSGLTQMEATLKIARYGSRLRRSKLSFANNRRLSFLCD